MTKRTRIIEDNSTRTTVIDDGGSGDSLQTTVVFELLCDGLYGGIDSPLEVSASSSADSHRVELTITGEWEHGSFKAHLQHLVELLS